MPVFPQIAVLLSGIALYRARLISATSGYPLCVRYSSGVRDRFATLSAREKQLVMLVTSGMMNKQVADDLGNSEITVKVHRAAAMRKMCATSLADLVRMADVIRRQSI
jgi:DNA-binding NarL/FixJ family response regulator